MKITQKLKQTLALTLIPRFGPVAFKNALVAFGSLEGIYASKAADWKSVECLSRLDRGTLDSPKLFKDAEEEIEKAFRGGADIVTFFDEAYPVELKEIYDPPILFYVKGLWSREEKARVALVGSRLSTIYGQKMAENISHDLAASGVTVVSGLAKGIDTAAHRGALKAEGRTIAVLGSGLSRVYPPDNKKLAEKILEEGALISEYHMTQGPLAENFPVRNRIISGLSRAVVVVEAREKSGALITANTALDQGRDVYAVPGPADSIKFKGSHQLLKQGARLMTDASDLLQDLGVSAGKRSKKKRISVSEEEQRLLSCLEGADRLHLDELIERSQFPTSKAMGLLSILTIKGVVQELPGKYFTEKV